MGLLRSPGGRRSPPVPRAPTRAWPHGCGCALRAAAAAAHPHTAEGLPPCPGVAPRPGWRRGGGELRLPSCTGGCPLCSASEKRSQAAGSGSLVAQVVKKKVLKHFYDNVFLYCWERFFAYSDSLGGLLVHLNISSHISAEGWEPLHKLPVFLRPQGFFSLASLTVVHSREAFLFSVFGLYIGEREGKGMGREGKNWF